MTRLYHSNQLFRAQRCQAVRTVAEPRLVGFGHHELRGPDE
jgi:hypothetical protein